MAAVAAAAALLLRRETAASALHYPPGARRLLATAAAAAGSGESWPVIVAGGGPTGLTTALLLARYGVPCLVLERATHLTDHPQAHLINMRTMEIFRGLDGLAEEVAAQMPPLHTWRNFVYCTTMLGGLLGKVDHFQGQTTPHAPDISPEPVAHLSQHRLLPLLARRAAEQPSIELRMGHSVTGMTQTPEGVQLEVATADGRSYTAKGRFLAAADGARGPLRRALGVPMSGPGAIQHLINIHFVSRQLGQGLAGREGMLYFVFNADTIAVMVAHNIEQGEFVAQIPYFPPLQTPDYFTPQRCAEVVRQAAGRPDLELEVRTVRAWTMAGRVADRYQVGSAFLVGDAAHVVPPSGAFGMNTGVQDAHNLAWKLAAVERGLAGAPLLGTYTAERRPVGWANMELSVANFNEALRVPQMLGLDYKVANALSDALASPALGWLPAGLRQGALEGAMSVGRAAASPLRTLRAAELAEVFERGETLRLQYPKEDLGFVYKAAGSAVCYEAGDAAAVAAALGHKPRDATYTPTTLPGARLPHAPLRLLRPGPLDLGSAGAQQQLTSTVDLPAAAGLGLVLLLGRSAALPGWQEAAASVAAATGVALHPVLVLEQSQELAMVEDSGSLVVVQDTGGAWQQLRGIPPEGALLVRPDGHVAWRCGVLQAGRQPAAALEHAVRTILALL